MFVLFCAVKIKIIRYLDTKRGGGEIKYLVKNSVKELKIDHLKLIFRKSKLNFEKLFEEFSGVLLHAHCRSAQHLTLRESVTDRQIHNLFVSLIYIPKLKNFDLIFNYY